MGSLSITAGKINPKSFSDSRLDFQTTRYRRTIDGVVDTDTYGPVTQRDYYSDNFSGRLLENFHKRKSSGELLPQTAYFNEVVETNCSGPPYVNYGFTTLSGGQLRDYRYDWFDSKALPMQLNGCSYGTVLGSNLVNTALEENGVNPHLYPAWAAAKLYSKGWDALTFLAELHQVVRMFKNVFRQFNSLASSYLGSRRSASGATNESFNTWLQGRYGWRILLYDIQDINKLIDGIGKKQRTRFSERTGQSFTYSVDNSKVIASDHRREITDLTEISLSVRGSVITDFVPSKVTLNPIVTAWELVPYSFVVDWFYNIGSALNALSFLVVSNKYTASIGYWAEATRNVSVEVSFPNPSWVNPYSNADQYSMVQTLTHRKRVPCVISTLPSLRVNLNVFKVMDLLALLGQLVTNLSRR